MKRFDGLTKKEAEKILREEGYNQVEDVNKISSLKIFLRQIRSNFVIYLLVVVTVISFFVGKNVTGYAILSVIVLIIVVGFVQEFRAEKAIKALRSMIMSVSIVIRDGKETEIPSTELVRGDIIVLRNGEKIPADCVVLEESDILVNESILTGEPREIKKKTVENLKQAKEENTIFMGTFVVKGKCVAKVVRTGMETKFGQISSMISSAEKELPLQKKINTISKYLATIGIIVSLLTGILIFLRTETISQAQLIEILILVIAIAVSSFPEGFPVVLITTLASGAYRMAQKNAIVNRMSIIETLGETTVICSDKTGTITKGEMTVKKIFVDGGMIEVSGAGYEAHGEFGISGRNLDVKKERVLSNLIKTAVLCNDSRIERTGVDKIYRVIGSPTEASLLIMAAKAGVFSEDLDFDKIGEVPFNSENKMMFVTYKTKSGKYVFSKGAPEILLEKCKYIEKKDGIFKLSNKDREVILKENNKLTCGTYRTLALAYKKNLEDFDKDLIFQGIVGIEDPPREEVAEAIKMCQKAGIKVKMITGDNRETAIAIAKQVGIKGEVIEGSALEKISDQELLRRIDDIAIFSRVKPEHKIRIVRVLKEKGEIVTMTGDGVNDAPALKEAHIGVAMGKNGTDVSRSVADLTLKDDNFATIVHAIREGRTIFKNIRKFVSYQLSCNVAELSLLFVGVLLAPYLGWQIPLLLAIQILFMNLVTSDLPAITLGFNPGSQDVMEEKPRKKTAILNRDFAILIAFTGIFMAFIMLSVFYISYNLMNESLEYSRTVALVALIIFEIVLAFQFRSFRKGILSRTPFTNKYLVYASLISILATLVIVYTSANKIFETVPLKISGWVIIVLFSVFLIVIFDLLKKINNKKKFIRLEHG